MRYLLILVALMVMGGCAGGPQIYKADYDKGSVLVLPARDVVQNGQPHEAGVGSGQLMTEKTIELLNDSGFTATSTQNNQFTHNSIPSKEAALNEAKQIGTQYCLQITLGEFRNAAPMTFRTDFVTLESATMFDVKSGKEVWRLEEPVLLEKSNLGNHLGLIETLAKFVSNSISKG